MSIKSGPNVYKKSPNVYKKWPKTDFNRKMKIFDSFNKLPKNAAIWRK